MMQSLLKTLSSLASMGLFPYTVSTAFTDHCWVQGHIYESVLSSPGHNGMSMLPTRDGSTSLPTVALLKSGLETSAQEKA